MSVDDEESAPKPVKDPGEQDYNQRQRLKEIWEERQNVREWRREISHSIGSSLTQSEAERHFHEELKQYLEVIHTLLIDVYAEDGGSELWAEKELGHQTIEPPAKIRDKAQPKRIPFVGLKSIIQTPSQRTVRFSTTVQNHRKSNQEITETRDVTVPWHILDTAWMHITAFLSQVGFEVKIGKDGRPYDDWREEFERGVYTGPEDIELPHVQG